MAPTLRSHTAGDTNSSLDISFIAYNLRGKKRHQLPSPPVKITDHRLQADMWKVTKIQRAKATKSKRAKATTTTKKLVPRTVGEVLRCTGQEFKCAHCERFSDDPACTVKCYRAFTKAHLTPMASQVEIRGPGPMGYGVFTSAKTTIKKGQYVGEYIGELLPLGTRTKSLYQFGIPGVCVVDAVDAGNWTRFVNSHCRPNLKAWDNCVGRRHAILLEAVRDIGPGEELSFCYGGTYFEDAGLLCSCDAVSEKHVPGARVKRKGRGKGKGR